MFSTTRPVDEPRVLFLVFVYTTVIQRDEGRGGGTRKVKRKGHRTRVIVVHDNTTVPRYVEEKKKKKKKKHDAPVESSFTYAHVLHAPVTPVYRTDCEGGGWEEEEERKTRAKRKKEDCCGRWCKRGRGCKRGKYPTHPRSPSPTGASVPSPQLPCPSLAPPRPRS